MRLFYFISRNLIDFCSSVTTDICFFSIIICENLCHLWENKQLNYFRLNKANLYPSIPKPDKTASVLAAVTDFCRNSSLL